MAEFPALLLWTDAYLGDTTHLTTIEHGAYLLLLMAMWRNKAELPNDDKLLARFARLSPAQWQRIKPTIMAFFTVDGSRIRQGRLTDEYEAVKRKHESLSDNALARWRKNKKSADADAYAGHVQPNLTFSEVGNTEPENESPSSETHIGQTRCNGVQSACRPPLPAFDPCVHFPAFWKAYPLRVKKRQAEKAYRAAVKRASPEMILAGVENYRRLKPPEQQWAHAATWLNGDRWEDQWGEDATEQAQRLFHQLVEAANGFGRPH